MSPALEKEKLQSAFSIAFEKGFKTPGERDLLVAVDIRQAILEFRAYSFRELQYVSTKLNVRVEDRTSGELIGIADGASWVRRKAVVPAHSYDLLFAKSLLNSFTNALNEISASQ